jgi:hypothetical protein
MAGRKLQVQPSNPFVWNMALDMASGPENLSYIVFEVTESMPCAQNSEASDPVVPMAMDADRDDGAGSVVYDIPGSFKALSLRSMNSSDESLLDHIQTY